MGRKTGTSFYCGWCAYNNDLMLKGYVLLDMRPDINSSSGKNVFVFKDTPQIRNSMSDYLNH